MLRRFPSSRLSMNGNFFIHTLNLYMVITQTENVWWDVFLTETQLECVQGAVSRKFSSFFSVQSIPV